MVPEIWHLDCFQPLKGHKSFKCHISGTSRPIGLKFGLCDYFSKILPPLETNLDPNPIPSTHGLASGLAKKAKQLDGQNHVFPHCLTLLSTQKVVSFVGMIWTILNPIGPHSGQRSCRRLRVKILKN